MSIASAFGFGKKVRYAAVGLGDITQRAMLPGIAHTGNSTLAALVSGDREKARAVGKRYGVDAIHTYDEFDALLASGTIDAIYLATPNWRHAEFAIPALRTGIHVLVEKPLEISSEQARAILAAERASSAKLMVAYRLHFEPATLDAIRRIRAGEIGDLVCFSSCFTQRVDPANHRAGNGVLAGPLFDMGPYPINAARYLFGAEPVEVVSAVATRIAGLGLDDTVAVTLRFPGDRLAQFTVSYAANSVDSFVIVGTKGSIAMSPAYGYGEPLEQQRIIGTEKTSQSFKATDQFGGEMRYFSDCILHGRDPEPDAEEGLADIRVIEGILRAIETQGPVTLEGFVRSRRIDPDAQEQTLRAVSAPSPAEEVRAGPPSLEE
ncbi:Gfo/Idh/MocA family oxidoreductase [Sphingomonas sp.]|jgi:predicted dehydrogenase|uniref:Gfo/Idh/MocA family protein n=1 Tax=Sphingomonas sp. TaxID=28214 RepID=UPI002ED78A7F